MKHFIRNSFSKGVPDFLKVFFYLGLTSFLLLWPDFWNGYPLVFSDTGAYIASAFSLKVPLDRPIGYGYFIRFFSAGTSLWFVVYAQAFLACYLLWKTVGIFFDKHRYAVHFFAVIALAFLTALPWVAGQLMPDIFPGLVFLTLFVFVFGKTGRFERCLLAFFYIWFLVTHSANFLLSFAVLSLTLLFFFVKKGFLKDTKSYLKRLGILLAVTLIAPVFFLVGNYREGNGFVLNPSSYVFMMARVNDAGVLDDFLTRNCRNVHYFLCGYQGHLPQGDGFIWNRESPVNIAGWKPSKTEYDTILRQIFTEPDLVVKFFGDSAVRTFRLFFMIGMDSFSAYGEAGPVYPQIAIFFPQELQAYARAKQYRGGFTAVDGFSILFSAVFCLSVLSLSWSSFKKTLRPLEKIFVGQTGLFLFFNALIMATLSGAYGRYQERLIWLALLPVLFIIFRKRFGKV